MNNVIGLDGKPKKPTSHKYNMRLCLVGTDDIDIQNILTFGIADDGFFMVKSYNNMTLPTFMTNPARIQSVEIYKEGDKPLTKLKKGKSDDDFLLDLLRKKHETQSKKQ
jgi:hypothetical protein|tara:strand:+ start:1732 stop:2058 length:327 start_codon:yes stop_codon:yes gene_type:complete